MGKRASNQYKAFQEKHPEMVFSRSNLNDAAGYTTEAMGYMGIDKQALKTLERAGMAIRGYTKNVYLPGETRPDKTVIPADANYTERGNGHTVRWILVTKE